jgi:hypothetical protein
LLRDSSLWELVTLPANKDEPAETARRNVVAGVSV